MLSTQCICVFRMVLTINSDCFHEHHWPVDLCSGDVMCFLWGTDWIAIYSDSLSWLRIWHKWIILFASSGWRETRGSYTRWGPSSNCTDICSETAENSRCVLLVPRSKVVSRHCFRIWSYRPNSLKSVLFGNYSCFGVQVNRAQNHLLFASVLGVTLEHV
jgi:hypothetical protein